jgi:hypothetical protein
MKFRSQSSTLLLVLFLMAAAVLLRIMWVRLPDVQNEQQRTLLIEIAKTLLQLAVIAVIGGAVKLVYDRIMEERREAIKAQEQERAVRKAQNEQREKLLNELIEARAQVEEARRSYRLTETKGALACYQETMAALLRARLKLSHIWNYLETSSYLFVQEEAVQHGIDAMKRYLDGLIDEYEDEMHAPRLADMPESEQTAYLRRLTRFGDFVDRSKERGGAAPSEYEGTFLVAAYRPAVKIMRDEVLAGI